MKKTILVVLSGLLVIGLSTQCSKDQLLDNSTAIKTAKPHVHDRSCAVDHLHSELYQRNPNLQPDVNPAHKTLEEFTAQFVARNKSRNTTSYTIPTVVHIIHDNGPENISDQAVLAGIQDLNDGMSGQTQNNNFIQSEFTNLLTNTNINFVLAKFDPDGNPTTGITRHVNRQFTNNANNFRDQMANYAWPRAKYFNIYVVKQTNTNNSSGWAYYPASVDDPAYAHLDGIMMASYAFGRHSNLYNEWYYINVHEVGHWLNLKHIWGGDTGNGSSSACNDDDDVADTPNTKGNAYQERSSCGTRESSCNSLDNTTNHMDYCAPCQALFTPGQTSRMEASLNSTIAERNNLWSAANLQETLGLGGGEDVPVTGVTVSPSSASVDVGSTVALTSSISPSNATNTSVTWSSSNSSIATVNSSGVVTGVADGSAIIIATTADGGFTDQSAITVTEVTGGVCAAPTSLSSRKLGNSGKRWRISWGEVSSASSYNFQYRRVGSSNWIDESTTNTYYNLSRLVKNGGYEARVQSVCGQSTSEWSSIINFN